MNVATKKTANRARAASAAAAVAKYTKRGKLAPAPQRNPVNRKGNSFEKAQV